MSVRRVFAVVADAIVADLSRVCSRMRDLVLIAVLALGPTLAAATAPTVIDLVAAEQDTQVVFAALRRLGREDQVIPPGTTLAPRVRLVLRHADMATVRQALAHAVDATWSIAPGGATQYRRDTLLANGPLRTKTYTSTLMNVPHWETVVRQALRPWLIASSTGLALDSRTGLWVATLDGAGHERLVDLLALLEAGQPRCPNSVPHPQALPPRAGLATTVTASTWSDLAERLSQQMDVSISCAPTMPVPPPVMTLTPGNFTHLTQALARLHLRTGWIDGVWCWGSEIPRLRQHLAQRSRFALLPVPVDDDATALLLSGGLQNLVAPGTWQDAGALLLWINRRRSFLVSHDPAVAHQVWDVLDRCERFGIDATLATAGEKP